MNRSFRLIWNDQKNTYVVAPETARGRGKRSGGRSAATVSALAASLLSLAAWGAPNTLPSGGQVSAGQASIASNGNAMTVTQGTQRAAINWQSFSVGSDASVNFQQPNAAAVILNRVVGSEQSVIDGALNANGQVFLLNANGLLFGKGASVNTAGLVATTLSLSDADFMAGKTTFTANGSQASVINLGTITTTDGGYVALLGHQVSNQGAITARLGTAALAAGDKISLNFNGNSLLGVVVDQGALNTLVENRQAILADGGLVVLTAKGLDTVLASAVNNTGEIRAQTVANQAGRILLLGDMQSGSVNVGGTLDASAPAGGNGGFVETSAAHVKVAPDTRVTTAAAQGQAGTWLIDPHDFTIAASGGDISGATLSSNLADGNITIQSSGGAAGVNGDLNVNDGVSWSANTLTLTAANNVNINTVMSATNVASLALNPATANGGDAAVAGGTVRVALGDSGFTGRVDFSSEGTLAIGGVNYTVINSLGSAVSASGSDLQGMAGNLAGHYVLGSDIDASSTSGWNGGAGFTPIGNGSTAFSGVFDGLGHTINGLTINRLGSDQVGLFGVGDSNSAVRNVGLAGASVSGKNFTGALMGTNHGSIANSYADAALLANQASIAYLGGLIGFNDGSIAGSHVGGTVAAAASYDVRVGGLVGGNIGSGTIRDSYTTSSVTITNNGVATPDAPTLGGLAGINEGAIINSYATGAVSGGNGGLVGLNNGGTISGSHATGAVANGDNVGGLVGLSTGGSIDNSYATGAVSGRFNVGGLVGLYNLDGSGGGSISNSYATGAVTATSAAGGLVGNSAVSISNAHASGAVSAAGWFEEGDAGGLAGYSGGAISDSYATGDVTSGNQRIGGLVGTNNSSITNSHSSGNVSGASNVGGLVGANGTVERFNEAASTGTGTIVNSYVEGVTVIGGGNVGGLVGRNNSTSSISASHAAASVTGSTSVGGLVGNNRGSIDDTQASGAVVSTVNWYGYSGAGGLVGWNVGTIQNSHASDSVSAPGGTVGGLVGYSNGNISNSYATGNVTANGDNVGGLAGTMDGGTVAAPTSISASYATGTVSGGTNVGGLVGNNNAAISNSYSDSTSVTGTGGAVGGLIGTNSANVSGTHATAAVSGNSSVGGLIGWNSGLITDGQASGSVTSGNWWGESDAGGLVGYSNGSIVNGHASGAVSANGDATGGLVGRIDAGSGSPQNSISNSDATGNVSGTNHVGGLVGMNRSAITASHAGTGTVTGIGDNVGGLVGNNDTGASIATSYSNGNVTGHTGVGGLVGANRGSVSDSQATGSVSAGEFWGGSSAGGLVGWNAGVISDSSAAGAVTATGSHVGGLVGAADGGSISGGHATGAVSGVSNVGGLVGISHVAVSNSDASGNVTGLGDNIGGLVGANDGGASISAGFSTGNVQGNNVVGGLVGVNNGSISDSHADTGTVTAGHYVGGLAGFNRGSIGNSYAAGAVTASGSNVGGLVGFHESGSISGTHASGAVSGGDSVGGLVGYSNAAVGNSYAEGGSVTGAGNNVGGLVGLAENASTITTSHASGNVAGREVVGGLVGVSNGSISDSYADTGTVTGINHLGGLVGWNRGSIGNSHATGAVTASGDNVGGLVGVHESGSISASHATGAVVGRNSVGGLAGYSNAAIGSSDAEGGSVTGAGSNVGGLVGLAEIASTITASHATGDVSGQDNVGGLAGLNIGSIGTSFSSGNVQGNNSVGGLVGVSNGSVSDSHADTGTVTGVNHLGGLVGFNRGNIGNSYANRTVTASGDNAGGLVGVHESGSISDSHATGAVVGGNSVGGLAGYSNAAIGSSYAEGGSVTGAGDSVGGLVGMANYASSITASHASGNVSGQNSVGGLAGLNNGSISTSHADGAVSGGNNSVGGLVGTADAGSITDSHATGVVSGATNVGGLVGLSRVVINNSDATGNVTGIGGSIGGLVGWNNGTISNSHADGAVSGNLSNIGGLVGANDGGSINTSHAGIGAVTGNTNVGGLVGYNTGSITGSQASSAVTGTGDSVGGLVGYNSSRNNNSGNISDSYSSGAVTGASNVGGLVGYNDRGTLSNSFYDVEQVSINGGQLLTAGGIHDAQYQDWIGHGRTLNIADYAATLPYDSASGTYGVSSAAGLRDMLGFAESNNAGLTFRLKNSIDLAQTPELWVPYFAASFDGGSRVIANASIQAQNINDQVGFFGQQLGAVNNLGLPNINVTGRDRTGGLVGTNLGNISNSYVEGTVTGVNFTGGLVGDNQGGISNSYAAAQVSGNVFVGGLVGTNSGIVDRTYATGQVNGNAAVAGLVGGNDGVVNAGFWDNAGGSLSTADAQRQDSYGGQGWDFNSTWVIYDGHTHPLLRSFMTPLTITANNAVKTYDGQVYEGSAGLSYSDTPDQSKLLGTVSYEGTRNAGSYTITPNGLYSNQQGYIISYGSGTLQVDQAVLTVSANGSASGKVYDGNTATSVSLASNGVSGDQLTLNYTSANFANANAGSGKTINVTGISVSGADAGNYILQSPTTTTTADISPKPVAVAALDGAGKVYDGSTAAASGLFTVTNGVSGDTVNLSGSATLAAKDVGTRSFELTGLGLDNGNYTLVGGTTSGTVAVTPRAVAVASLDGAAKVYDGSTAAASGLFTVTNVVGGDALHLSGDATLAAKDVGNRTFSLNGLNLDNGNYTLVGGTATGTVAVTPRAVAVASLDSAAKVYDGSTAAASGLFTVTNVVGSDALHLSGDATLAAKDVGNRTFSLNGLNLDNGNYTLVGGTTSGTVAVTPRAVAVASLDGATKVYDGSTAATSGLFTVTNVVGGDVLHLSGDATLAAKDVGTRSFELTGLGLDNGNYTLVGGTTSGTVAVTPRAVAVASLDGAAKVYDGSTAAASGLFTVTNVVGGDALHLSGDATLAAKDVGNRTFSLTGLALDNGNYTLVGGTTSGTVAVTPRAVAVASLDGAAKVYDGSTAATSGLFTVTNVVGGDALHLSGDATLAAKDVGNRTFSLNGLALDNGNYTLVGGTATGTVAVTPRAVAVASLDGAAKVYDGSTAAASQLFAVTNVVGGDALHLSGDATLAAKDVGNRTFSLNGLALDNGNYTLVGGTATGTVAVTPRAVAVASLDGAAKVYDGSTAAASGLFTVTNIVGGDALHLSGDATLAAKDVGNRTFSLTGLALDNGNYTLVGGTTSGTVAVTARPVSYVLTLADPTQSFTATGQNLYTPGTIGGVLQATVNGLPVNGSPVSLGYTLWKDGTQVSAVKDAGSYEVRAGFNPANPDYSIVDANSTVLRFTVSNPASLSSVTAVAIVQQPTAFIPAGTGGGTRTSSSGNPTVNVVSLPTSLSDTFGSGTRVALVSSPSANEPTQTITLSEARGLIGGDSGNGSSSSTGSGTPGAGSGEGSREVRVPVSRNSLAEIVNGGVKLPSGVEQQLFIVKQ